MAVNQYCLELNGTGGSVSASEAGLLELRRGKCEWWVLFLLHHSGRAFHPFSDGSRDSAWAAFISICTLALTIRYWAVFCLSAFNFLVRKSGLINCFSTALSRGINELKYVQVPIAKSHSIKCLLNLRPSHPLYYRQSWFFFPHSVYCQPCQNTQTVLTLW